METINLRIPNMKSPHCMMVVSGALKNLPGAALKKVVPGEAEIELSGATRDSVVETIEKAGYPVTNK
ncbi:MAG: heavy-metal-associated domain-containing protein [Cyclobacteriaceae bacterium]|nr:heavy-metal-associated domain-containing protein [Cyclobacteriaceae bacterium]